MILRPCIWLSACLASLAYLSGCSGDRPGQEPSQLATVKIGEMNRDFDRLDLEISLIGSDESRSLVVDRELSRDQATDLDVTLTPARYHFRLGYSLNGQIIYDSAACTKPEHVASQTPEALKPGMNQVKIYVCAPEGDEVVIIESPEPDDQQDKTDADVAIDPIIVDQEAPANEAVGACGLNPFRGKNLNRSPRFQSHIESTLSRLDPGSEIYGKVSELKSVSTAVWIDRFDSISKIEPALDRANSQTMTTFVVYNLPVRDCSAAASAGEYGSNDMDRYKVFIEEVAQKFSQYSDRPISVILEVDSLPNLVTNLSSSANCRLAAPIYKEGIAFAIATLAKLSHVSLYMDIAHSRWLGWNENRQKMASIIKEVLDLAGGHQLIRGFASNVSNVVGLANGPDYGDFNPTRGELDYVKLMSQDLEALGITGKGYLIDTGRSGNPKADPKQWCNNPDARLGPKPQVAPSVAGACVDAYLWVKPPGESDGVSDPGANRFDQTCAAGFNSAPQAGEWFEDYFLSLFRPNP